MFIPTHYTIHQQNCWLSPLRAIFWEEEKAVIMADLHLGKSGHFRKNGIAIPQSVYQDDLHRMIQIMQYFQPQKLIVVGDLFHSHANKELDLFCKWRNDFPVQEVLLVKGNHDILPQPFYKKAGITLTGNVLHLGETFAFIHDLKDMAQESEEKFYFSGHIHPGIRLAGMAKQQLSFPCFYRTERYMVLPAFGNFTGLHHVKPQQNDHIFAIVENKILQFQ